MIQLLAGVSMVLVSGASPSLKDDVCCTVPESQLPGSTLAHIWIHLDVFVFGLFWYILIYFEIFWYIWCAWQCWASCRRLAVFSMTNYLRWYRPEDHLAEVEEYVTYLRRTVTPTWSVLDLFGASRRVAKAWSREGYSSVSFDIKLSQTHDLCTQVGFFQLLKYGMESLGWNVLKCHFVAKIYSRIFWCQFVASCIDFGWYPRPLSQVAFYKMHSICGYFMIFHDVSGSSMIPAQTYSLMLNLPDQDEERWIGCSGTAMQHVRTMLFKCAQEVRRKAYRRHQQLEGQAFQQNLDVDGH